MWMYWNEHYYISKIQNLSCFIFNRVKYTNTVLHNSINYCASIINCSFFIEEFKDDHIYRDVHIYPISILMGELRHLSLQNFHCNWKIISFLLFIYFFFCHTSRLLKPNSQKFLIRLLGWPNICNTKYIQFIVGRSAVMYRKSNEEEEIL